MARQDQRPVALGGFSETDLHAYSGLAAAAGDAQARRVDALADTSICAVRAAAAHLAVVESELAQARARLAAAEAVLAATPPPASPDALTVEQVADALSLGRTTVAEMIRTGGLRSVKIGKCRRVFRADLDAYIARMRAGEAGAA